MVLDRITGLFKSRKPDQDEVTRKKEIAEHGKRLGDLKLSVWWGELLKIRHMIQEQGTIGARSLSSTHEQRYQAAVQWATIEVFFKEIDLRIKRGEEVAKELQELNAKK